MIKGNLKDVSALREVLKSYENKADLGYATGGLAGWIDYDGNYTFGLYERFWVYAHVDEAWIQQGEGNLGEAAQAAPYQLSDWEPTITREQYQEAVLRAQEYIAAGQIYQVNLAQEFRARIEKQGDLFSIYEQLRESTPAPMACYGHLDGVELLCSSPETFLRMSGGVIETRPIKGTSPRYADAERDNLSAYQLMTSEKEKAELLMITDLLRNDLGQVSEIGSVVVEELLSVEQLAQVYHMVSTVKGVLRAEVDHLGALQACLPGGSITGAPKLRARGVIDELEVSSRGLYTGVAGFIGFNGESQFNIIIRSLVAQGQSLSYHVGAGIVADSNPEKEYEETLIKAEGIRRALKAAR